MIITLRMSENPKGMLQQPKGYRKALDNFEESFVEIRKY